MEKIVKKTITTLFKKPWFYILLIDLLLVFILFPLGHNPNCLYSFLPVSWYDVWEEFAIMQMPRFLMLIAFILWLFAIVITFYKLLIYKILRKPQEGEIKPYAECRNYKNFSLSLEELE